MPQVNYNNTVIYQLICKDAAITDTFVIHTTNYRKWKYQFKKDCESNKQYMHTIINETGGWNNWYTKQLEKYTDCMNKTDANDRANKWYDSVKPVTKSSVLLPYKEVTVEEEKPNTKLSCKYCNKNFSRSDNMKRHMVICKYKDAYETYQSKLEESIAEYKAGYEEVSRKLESFLNENCKIHPKTLTKINNIMQQNIKTINNNSNNSMNMNINNNHNYIVELGKENIGDLFTREEKTEVLKKRFSCLDYLIESVHFNDKYKQFQNIAITNIHDSIAYKYVESANKFISVDKDVLLGEILSCRMEDICEFFENHDELDLDRLTISSVKNFIDKMENDKDKLKETKMRDIRLIVYNQRDMMKPKLITAGKENI